MIGCQQAQQAADRGREEMADRETELSRGCGDRSDGPNPEAIAARIFAFLSRSRVRVAAARAAMSAVIIFA